VCMLPDKTRQTPTSSPATRGRILKGLSTAYRMRSKLRTKEGKKCYTLRKESPEPVFGQIKQARGFRQFLLRGLANVKEKWRLFFTRKKCSPKSQNQFPSKDRKMLLGQAPSTNREGEGMCEDPLPPDCFIYLLLEQPADFSSIHVHIHPSEGGVRAGSGHQADGASHRAKELSTGVD
jgi:hypothetical protein